jgi:hypothetical protein
MKDRLATLLVVIGLAGLFYLGSELKSLTDHVASGSHAQLINRATNVETWCSAINQGRDYNRAYINSFSHVRGGHPYTLRDLDCRTLIAKTIASPHGSTLTPTSHPLTYELLHRK